MAAKQEGSARESMSDVVHCIFPGIWFQFAQAAALLTTELPDGEPDSFLLHYCHTGRLQIEVDGRTVSLTNGDIWITPICGTIAATRLLSKQYSGASLYVSPKDAQAAVSALTDAGLGVALNLKSIAAKLRYLERTAIIRDDWLSWTFASLFSKNTLQYTGLLRLRTIELLVYLTAWEPTRQKESHAYLDHGQMEKLDEIRCYLTEHLECRWTQAQIAKQFHVSLTALKSMFQCIYGMPIDAYLREQRVALAKQLLGETKLPVAEIAHRVGYESHSQFTAVFRAKEGMTPIQYRQSQIKNEFK